MINITLKIRKRILEINEIIEILLSCMLYNYTYCMLGFINPL